MSKQRIPPTGRLAAVDYGTKRIGLALCDARQTISSPAETVASTGSPRRDADVIAKWLAEREVAGVVVGLPLSMDGSDSEQTRTVRAFARLLEAALATAVPGVTPPVALFDERLTSFAADELLRDSDAPRTRRAGRQDAVAAALILRGYIESRTDSGKRE